MSNDHCCRICGHVGGETHFPVFNSVCRWCDPATASPLPHLGHRHEDAARRVDAQRYLEADEEQLSALCSEVLTRVARSGPLTLDTCEARVSMLEAAMYARHRALLAGAPPR